MKKLFNAILLSCLCLLAFACKTNVETQTAIIPSNKTGVVISNPFKDDSKFESRAITYYTKYDVEYYQISVWCSDTLGETQPTKDNTVASLKISKDDSYTAKTLTFDCEGTYIFKCEAFTTNNELIADDTVTKKLTFANAEFIIFYLVPKIKTQTADVSATIKWAGDDDTKIAHVIRIVRPFDKVDVTINVLQNGKCSYNADALAPVLVRSSFNQGNSEEYKLGTVKLSDCDISSMVGKVGESYSFSLQMKVKTDENHNSNDYFCGGDLLSWMISYNENNEISNENFNENMHWWNCSKSAIWIFLDGKIYKSVGKLNDGGTNYNSNTLDALPQTEQEVRDQFYKLDNKGNVITLGEYVSTTYGSPSGPDIIEGALLSLENVPESAYANNIFTPTVSATDPKPTFITVNFKPVITPYDFGK